MIELRYSPGLFLNALDPASAIKNENMWIGLEEDMSPHRRIVVRQIAGLIARALDAREDDTALQGIRREVAELAARFPLYPERLATPR